MPCSRGPTQERTVDKMFLHTAHRRSPNWKRNWAGLHRLKESSFYTHKWMQAPAILRLKYGNSENATRKAFGAGPAAPSVAALPSHRRTYTEGAAEEATYCNFAEAWHGSLQLCKPVGCGTYQYSDHTGPRFAFAFEDVLPAAGGGPGDLSAVVVFDGDDARAGRVGPEAVVELATSTAAIATITAGRAGQKPIAEVLECGGFGRYVGRPTASFQLIFHPRIFS